MISVTENTNEELIKSIVTNNKLFELSGHTGSKYNYSPNMNNLWLKIDQDNTTIGFFELKEFTKICFDGHIYIAPEYWGKGLARQSIRKALEYLDKFTFIKTVLLSVPEKAIHVLKMLSKTDAKACGIISNAAIYQNKLQNIILFELKI